MNRRLPSFVALPSFKAAGYLGRLTLAANELGVSQVAVSHQVRQLETYLEVFLFTRRHRKIEVMRDWKQLLRGLVAAFDDIDNAVKRVSPVAATM